MCYFTKNCTEPSSLKLDFINTDPAGDPGFGLLKAYPAPCLTLCNRRQESDSDI